jgi:hypothetical protein
MPLSFPFLPVGSADFLPFRQKSAAPLFHHLRRRNYFKKGPGMKSKYRLIINMAICILLFLTVPSWAEEQQDAAALSMLGNFLANSAARADYASSRPDALQAEQSLKQFPPEIQKRIERLVLMIMQESGAGASRHVEASKTGGAEGAFNSFSPAVQREIAAIARELERNPEFMKKMGARR